MRNLRMFAVVTAITALVGAAPPVSGVTLTQWAGSPLTVGDKSFTLISTTWAGGDNFTVTKIGTNLYGCTLSPVSDNLLTNTTKSLVFKVTIVNDPATPLDETMLMHFSQVSGDGNRFIASGSFTVTNVFDDNGDFSSPLVTMSNSGTPWGPSITAGNVKELYVRLTFVASGSTLLTSYSVTFTQAESPVPAELTSWGNIKALYR